MTERFLASDPPTDGELAACAGAVRELLAARVPGERRDAVRAAIGVAGTVTTLAALELGLVEYDPERVHGHRIAAAGVERELERLASLPVEERRAVPGLEPERAPVIVAGIVVVREVLAFFGLDGLEASERDLLHGAALAAAELPPVPEGAAPPGAYTCC
jgi:exopolyphosphatase/guanosine-5'-triphosphate,3'-diphosphate pyrophosphatase